jgi:hypothetical protein
MSATQGIVAAVLALLVGVGLLVGGQLRLAGRGARAAATVVGGALCVAGVLWLLLSIAGYGDGS